MTDQTKKILLAVGTAVILAVAGYFGYKQFTAVPEVESPVKQVTEEDTAEKNVKVTVDFGDTTESFTQEVKEGVTALDLLMILGEIKGFEVKTVKYDMGEFIEGIGDKTGNKDNFWAFYINGEMAEVGAGAYEVKPGDEIEFKYSPVSEFKME